MLIDALIATRHNAGLNKVVIDQFSSTNLLEDPSSILVRNTIDLLVIGDMCYDDQLAQSITRLITFAHRNAIHVLLADPGRYSFKSIVADQLSSSMKRVCEYPIVDHDYMEPEFQSIQIWSST